MFFAHFLYPLDLRGDFCFAYHMQITRVVSNLFAVSALQKRYYANPSSLNRPNQIIFIAIKTQQTLPLQKVPFPANPLLQVHAYDPMVLLQVAWEWHIRVSDVHSSLSKLKINIFSP